jgi:hypothetical protein
MAFDPSQIKFIPVELSRAQGAAASNGRGVGQNFCHCPKKLVELWKYAVQVSEATGIDFRATSKRPAEPGTLNPQPSTLNHKP